MHADLARSSVRFALALLLCGCSRTHKSSEADVPSAAAMVLRDAGSDAELAALDAGQRDASEPVQHDAGAPVSQRDAGSQTLPSTTGPATTAPLQLVRTRGWPGGGVQLIVTELPSKVAATWPAPKLTREDGTELALEQVAVGESAGITALVIAPAADEAEHATRLEAARALVEALPASERIGIWLGSAQLPLLCELTERRSHVLARLAAIAPASAEAIDPTALDALQRRLYKVAGPYGPAARTLIGLGLPPLAAATDLKAVRLLPFGPVSDPDAFGWSEPAAAATAGQELAGALLRVREQTYRLGACGVRANERLVLSLGAQQIETSAPAELSGSAAACDAGAAARDEYAFPVDVALVMDEAQLAEHDRLAAAKDESDFLLQFAFGDGEPIPARAHFRGQTSLDCARKSYSVHFSDNEARRLMPRAQANEFLLLSMCWDKGWFRQVVVNRVMSMLGLFPLQQRYVRLRAADRELGVYLMLEKPDEALRSQQSNLAGLVRRRYDPAMEPPESQYPKPEKEPERAAQGVEQYLAMVALIDTTPPAELALALSARMDLDQYLYWLAVMNYFQSGDYADEVYFYASEELAADGGWYFRTLGWDSDDLFVTCHHNAKYSIKDEYGLAYCIEANLDRALFVAPDIYRRFATGLATLIEGQLKVTDVHLMLEEIRAELHGLLVEDAVCVGTGLVLDGQPAACAQLHPWLDATMDEFKRLVKVRAEGLLQRERKVPVTP